MREVLRAVRGLLHSPWYSGAVVGVVGLSSGLAIAVFAVVDGVLFTALPFARPAELYAVSSHAAEAEVADARGGRLSVREIAAIQSTLPEVDLTVVRSAPVSSASRTLGDLRSWLPSPAEVDARFFAVLGTGTLMGSFAPDDFDVRPGSPTPALISHSLWQSNFGGRRDVIGQAFDQRMGDFGATGRWRVAGVLPPEFVFPGWHTGQNLLVPLVARSVDPGTRSFDVIVRLPSTLSGAEVNGRLASAARLVADEQAGRHRTLLARPLVDFVNGADQHGFRRASLAVLGLFLLTCVNLTGLTTLRVLDRRRDLAVRRALGAGPTRLFWQVCRECALLIGAGWLLGLFFSQWVLAIIVPLLPASMGQVDLGLDGRAIGFTVICCLAATMLVAMGPTRAALKHTIGDLTSWAAAGTMPGVGARAVISLQVAIGLSLTLTGVPVVAGMVRLWGTNVGFDSDSLLVVTAETTGAPEPASVEADIAQFLRAVRRLPGVTAAGVTRSPSILRRGVSSGPFENADTYPVSAGFFEAIRPELVAGRLPSDAQLDRRESVAVISEEVARERFGADEMALGRAIVPTDGTPALTVIAVVGETRFSGWDLAAVLRLAAEDLSPVRVLRAAEADALLGETVRPRRFVAWMYGLLAVASLAIVCAGVFGQVAMATARRSREMGIRVALGATGRGVIMLLVREQVSAALVGLAAGSLAAFWMVGLVRAYVYEVSVYDARLWLATAVAIILAAGAAAAVPPWRASRVDPVTVLRSE